MTHLLTLPKCRHLHVLRYESGDEGRMMDALVEMGVRGELTWADVKRLATEMGERTAGEIGKVLTKGE